MVTKNKWHDHKVVGVARNLQRSSVWIPLLRQGQLELVAQDHIQLSYVFKDGDSGQTISMFYMFPCDPPGQTISMFEHLHNRHFFSHSFLFIWNSGLCLLALLFLGTNEKSLTWLSSPLSLLCYKWESGCNAKNIIQMRNQAMFQLAIRKTKSLF